MPHNLYDSKLHGEVLEVKFMFVIDYRKISTDALKGLAENYVYLMQGSDPDSTPLEQRVDFTINSVKSGVLSIVFSELHNEARIVETKTIRNS